MNDRPREFDPQDPRLTAEPPHVAHPSEPLPRDPLVRDSLAYDPLDPVPPVTRSSGRAGLVLLAMVAALFVIGFIAFSGPGVDDNPTAGIPNEPATQEEILPNATQPVAPNPGMVQPEAPAAAPQPVNPAPTESTPAPAE